MKIKRFIIFIVFITFLGGCSGKTTTEEEVSLTLTLKENSELVYEVLGDLALNQQIDLPILEAEGMIFAGWSDGESLFFRNYIITDNATLTAVFEDVKDVIDYSNIQDVIWISGYTGQSKYLRIPAMIDGFIVRGIMVLAFADSPLIEVEIPNSVTNISNNAFTRMENLVKISFYGDYVGQRDLTLGNFQYDDLMEKYGEDCVKSNVTNSSWDFSEGCFIKSVNNISPPVSIGGKEYFSYHVTIDIRYYEFDRYGLTITSSAFYDLPALSTVEFPRRYGMFIPDVFSKTPKLSSVSFYDNPYYEVIEGVVYNEEITNLVFAPMALTLEELNIPDTVEEIMAVAFRENQNIKNVYIPVTVNRIHSSTFVQTNSLERIIVAEENNYYYDDDGVLYANNHTLVRYPSSRPGSTYILPETTKILGPLSFAFNENLQIITLNEGLTNIAYAAFMETEKLKLLDIPASVVYIDNLFTLDSSIEIVIIRRSQVEDGSITQTAMVTPYPGMPNFYFPNESFNAYKQNSNWQYLLTYLKTHSDLPS